MVADHQDEVFEIVDDSNRVVGTEQRAVVHANGLLHRAVYCFVLNSTGSLLLQRRSARKRIGPLQWDLSVAEHLQPGETYRRGASRGLKEELGIDVPPEQLQGPLAAAHLRHLELPGSFCDREFVESYRLDGYDGAVDFDIEEVAEVKWQSLAEVQCDMRQRPHDFTPWFKDELAALGGILQQPGEVTMSR